MSGSLQLENHRNLVKAKTSVIEASIKPYINFVWVGTVTLVVGFVLTIVKRVAEARMKDNV